MISGTSARYSAEVARQSSLSGDIAKLQDQISTGKKSTDPSDDPTGNARVGAIRQVQADDAAYLANVNTASATATRVDSAMTSLSDTLDRARELVTAANNGTSSATDRAAAATELRGLAQDVSQLATSKDSRGNLLFPEDAPNAVPIAPGVQVAATVSKNTLFGITGADGKPTDIATMLNAAADAVSGTDATQRTTDVAASLTAIIGATSQVADVHADQGVRAARIDARTDAIASETTSLATERSGIEDTDISAAISLITSKMTTLQAAQAVFAKVNARNLFSVLS